MMDYLPRTVEPTADDYNALVDKINELMSGGSSAASSYIPSGIGGGTVNVGPQPIWAKITGGGSGGIYSWTRVVPTGAGSFSVPPFPDNVSGTTGYLWAAEATGRTDVPVDGSAIVRLEQSEVGPWFDFRYTVPAATGSTGNQVNFCFESQLPGGILFTLGSTNNGSFQGQPGVIVPVGYIVRGIFTVNWTVIGSPSNKFIWDSSWGVSWQNSGSLLANQQGGIVTQFAALVPWGMKDPAVSGEQYIMSFSCQIGFYGQSTSASPDQVLLNVSYGPSFGANNSLIVTSKSAVFTVIPPGGTSAPSGVSIGI